MSISVRRYLFPEQGEPQRISQRLANGLVFGEDAIPEYAGSRQKVLTVFLDNEDGQPERIFKAEGSIWVFDEDGKIREGLLDALREAMNSMPTPADSTVVDIRPRLSRKRLAAKYRWDPTQSDLDRVASDIWPKGNRSRLKAAKGKAPKRPPLTFDANHALSEATEGFWKIQNAIENLKEPSLKGFAFEARRRSAHDPDYAVLYRALADMADQYLEILRRRRTGKGVWYAVVEVMVWRDGIGEAAERHYERCGDRDEAVLAVRRMLAEHAKKFNDYTTVEAEMLTDLEWEQRAYPD